MLHEIQTCGYKVYFLQFGSGLLVEIYQRCCAWGWRFKKSVPIIAYDDVRPGLSKEATVASDAAGRRSVRTIKDLCCHLREHLPLDTDCKRHAQLEDCPTCQNACLANTAC
eukprot:4766671-Amphidinium_carterae.1